MRNSAPDDGPLTILSPGRRFLPRHDPGLAAAALLAPLQKYVAMGACLLFAGLVGNHALEQWKQGAYYRDVAALTPYFMRSLDGMRERIAADKPAKIAVLYPQDTSRSYMYVEQGGLAQFMLPRNAPVADIRALDQITSIATIAARPDPTPAAGELVIVLLMRTWDPKKVLFGKPN